MKVARSVMRRENLWHAASSVVVRDPLGRIYLHRRTTTKDVYPGLLDFAAGGVVLAGEDAGPRGGARGRRGAGGARRAPRATRRRGLRRRVTRATTPTASRPGGTVRSDGSPRRCPGVTGSSSTSCSSGSSRSPRHSCPTASPCGAACCAAGGPTGCCSSRGGTARRRLVEGRWVDRTPRRPEVERQLLSEADLLPLIGDTLRQTGIEVPRPRVVRRQPLTVRHPIVVGRPADPERLGADDGDRLGRFLSLLHGTADSVVAAAGLPSAADDLVETADQLERLRHEVFPLLDAPAREVAATLLATVAVPSDRVLCHADLVPEHVLVREGRVAGIIDWGDARVTDPAIDLAWPLHGTNRAFAGAVRTAYGASDDVVQRPAPGGPSRRGSTCTATSSSATTPPSPTTSTP